MKSLLIALAFLCLLALQASAQSTLLNGLESHWKLDGPNTYGLWPDSHGANDLSPNGTLSAVGGVIGNAVGFSSQDGRLGVTGTMLQATSDFTLVGWCYIDGSSELFDICGRNDSEYRLIAERANSGDWFIQFVIGDSWVSCVQTDPVLQPQTWHFIEANYDSMLGLMTLRVDNGSEYATETAVMYGDPGISVGSGTFFMGQWPSSLWKAQGKRDSWSFYNRLLTRAEAASLYNGGAGLDYPFD